MFQESLQELFPSWKAVERYRDVISFTTGLMKEPRPLVDHVYQMLIEHNLSAMRGMSDNLSIDVDLLKSLYTESTFPLHGHPLRNNHINYYNYRKDDKITQIDTNPIYTPSKLYLFCSLRENVTLDTANGNQETEPKDCAMFIDGVDDSVNDSILLNAQRISKQQPISDLLIQNMRCDFTTAEAPTLSNVRSLIVANCVVPVSFLKNIMHQLLSCRDTLQHFVLSKMDLRELEPLMDELLEYLVSHHERGLAQTKLRLWLGDDYYPTNLSEQFETKWQQCCEGVKSIDCQINR